MTRFVGGALLAWASTAYTGAAFAADNFWLEIAAEQARRDAGPGPIPGIIDYGALRGAMRKAPDQIRAQLKACGNCADRARLERSLAEAERDTALFDALEAGIADIVVPPAQQDPFLLAKLGIRYRPPDVRKQPPACIALYDRAMQCAVAHDDRTAGALGKPCRAESRLHNLCAAGAAGPFYDYVAFLQRKERGELVYETDGNEVAQQRYYYNVRPDTQLPQSPVPDNQVVFSAYTDSTQPGRLRSVSVTGMSRNGPQLRFSLPSEFREPWRSRLIEDYRAVFDSARILDCGYALPQAQHVETYKFWYRIRPTAADPAELASRIPHHPLLRIGPPLDTCPGDVGQATALAPSAVDGDTLRARYEQMLSRPGDTGPSRAPTPDGDRARRKGAEERARARQSR